MKHCAAIASHNVCSNETFIVYSHTRGLIGGGPHLEDARQIWSSELAKAREWGRESDAAVFEWSGEKWLMCGNLYDDDEKGRMAEAWQRIPPEEAA
jgi:hypothetical protein